MIEDKTYTVTPESAVTVKAGIVTGEVTEMKVTERVEKGSDRVVSRTKTTKSVTTTLMRSARRRTSVVTPFPSHSEAPRRGDVKHGFEGR